MRVVPADSTAGRVALVADDDDEMRSLAGTVLRGAGLTVVEVPDGLALIEYLSRAARPALVVTDLQMPGATGLRVIRYVRRLGLEVPIILVTAFGNRRVHAEAVRLGATAVLDKPFAVSALRELALRLLDSSEEPSSVRGDPRKSEREAG